MLPRLKPRGLNMDNYTLHHLPLALDALGEVFGADFKDLPFAQKKLLVHDVILVCDEAGFLGGLYGAALELQRRIGGTEKLASYVRTLEAGAARRGGFVNAPDCRGCGWKIRGDVKRRYYCQVCDPSMVRENRAERAAQRERRYERERIARETREVQK